MAEKKRVNEGELKAFLYKDDVLENGKYPSWVKHEWDYLMNLFDPPSMYVKNSDGTFSLKE